MNRLLENFQKLMEKFKFIEPISLDVQKFVLSKSRVNLVSILKGAGNYSLVFGRVLHIYYIAKKIGKKISFAQSKIILAILSAYFIIAVLLAGYYFKESFKTDKTPGRESYLEDREHLDKKTTLPDKEKKDSEKKQEHTIKQRSLIGVEHFLSTDERASSIITKTILIDLQSRLGHNKAVSLSTANRRKVPRILMGSVRKMGAWHIISVKIVNTESSKVEYSTYEKVQSSEEYDNACKNISERVAQRIK